MIWEPKFGSDSEDDVLVATVVEEMEVEFAAELVAAVMLALIAYEVGRPNKRQRPHEAKSPLFASRSLPCALSAGPGL